MASDPQKVIEAIQKAGEAAAQRAFIKCLGNIQGIAVALCPVGHYGAKPRYGRVGGELANSLHVEFTGRSGDTLTGRCTSTLPYAGVQHSQAFHHPGLYSGSDAGPAYASRFFERAVVMEMFGVPDPLGLYTGKLPATFEKLLKSEAKKG